MNLLVGSGKHVVDDVHELHNPFVQMEILQALKQVGVLTTIGANHRDLLRLCLCREDGYFKLEGLQGHRLKGVQDKSMYPLPTSFHAFCWGVGGGGYV